MTALILLSHGSRHPHADAGVEALAAAVEEPAFVAHLDFSGQDLQHTAGLVREAGHREAIVVPLLFTHAFHARFDVPRVVREAEEALGLTLHISAGLGTGFAPNAVPRAGCAECAVFGGFQRGGS